jgi:Na+/H+-dicarboxylate symporter
VIFSGIVAGIVMGTTNKELSAEFAPFGDIYLSLLQMCVLPIMITAIISSLGRLLTTGRASSYLGRLVIVLTVGLTLAGTVGVTAGLISQPGKGIDSSDRITMGKTIYEAEVYSERATRTSWDVLSFIRKMVPTNIFRAIAEGQNLAVLFFSILTGVALGLIGSASSNATLSVIDSLYDAFLKIIGWMMYGLPFGLMCLLADQTSKLSITVMFAMFKFVILFYAGAFVMIIGYSIVIWLRVGGSYVRSLLALKEPLMVALGTSSSFASIPSALRGLHKELKLEKQTADLVIPLGISLNPQGSVVHFAMAAVFVSQIYGISFGLKEIGITLFGSIVAAMAAAGVPGLIGLGMISIVLDPLGLPVKVAVILLAAIDPIIDPILTAVNVYGNCALTALIAKKTDSFKE